MMMRRFAPSTMPMLLGLAALAGAFAPAARAQDGGEIVRTAIDAYLERIAHVDNFTAIQTVQGMEVVQYFEKREKDGYPIFVLIPPHEYAMDGLEDMQGAMPTGDAAGGLPSVPNISDYDPRQKAMDAGMKALMKGLQDAGEEDEENAVFMDIRHMSDLATRAVFDGMDEVDGREAYVVRVDNFEGSTLTELMQGSGASLEPTLLKVWIDAEDYVALKTVMEGEIEMEGERTATSSETLLMDYREVEGMLEPFHRKTQMAGMGVVIPEKERKEIEKELAEAQKEMARAQKECGKMEEQRAQLPPEQRKMIEAQMGENQMGRNMEKYGEMMAAGGPSLAMLDDFTVEIVVQELRVNEGPPRMAGISDVQIGGIVEIAYGRGVASASSFEDPERGRSSAIVLFGAPEGGGNVTVQLIFEGELPSSGTFQAQGMVLVLGSSEAFGAGSAEEGATITIDSRVKTALGDELSGEFEFEAEGVLQEGGLGPLPSIKDVLPGEEGRQKGPVTVKGTFRAMVAPDVMIPGMQRQPDLVGN